MKAYSVVLVCVSVIGMTACNSTQANAPQPAPKVFSQADVAKAQEEITHDYQNRGFEVEQISLIKDSDRHLSGFVKFRRASGIIRPQLTRSCSATMDQDSGKYIYGCQ
jgi:hypothetical protein